MRVNEVVWLWLFGEKNEKFMVRGLWGKMVVRVGCGGRRCWKEEGGDEV
jgi:hypothetical protein